MNHPRRAKISRRELGRCAVGAGALTAFSVNAWAAESPLPTSSDHGQIKPPRPVAELGLVRHDGGVTTLPTLVRARATAIQLIFTSCTMTCPIQGAIFERVQKAIPDQVAKGIQLLSLSVDPKRDTPAVLTKWLSRFHARPGWIAASPRVADVERLRDFAGRSGNPSDNHSTQVLIVNREGLLVWRTFELPEASEVATILRQV